MKIRAFRCIGGATMIALLCWGAAIPALGRPPAAEVRDSGAQEPGNGEGGGAEPPAVAWQPWSDALFARAREEGKGVLLTVSSRWCRPCIVSDEQIFTDRWVRRLISDLWIPVRVDRDDRPDLYDRYHFACAILTRGRIGLPIIGFLFPTGEAIWADRYRPLEDREGRPGLRTLLARMDQFWKKRTADAVGNARIVQREFDAEARVRRRIDLGRTALSAIMDAVIAQADHEHGGYGSPPRQNNPLCAETVLLAAHRRQDPGLRDQALRALRGAANGALHDPIGGGFHVATRDEAWAHPFFDKSLVVNASYLHALVEAYRASGDEDLRHVAGRTIDYVLGTLAAPGGGFWSGQAPSADPSDETAYYTWRVEEARALISAKDLPWARLLIGFRDEGDLMLGAPARFTLKRLASPEEAARAVGGDVAAAREAADRILGALSKARSEREPPPILDGRYVDSTALGASSLIVAGMALDRPDALDAGIRALDDVLKTGRDLEKGVEHKIGAAPGEFSPLLMADLVHLGDALLDAWEATGKARYLEGARKTASGLRSLYLDAEGGGFFDVLSQPEAAGYVRIRRKVLPDSATPSPQASAARLLDRLAAITGDDTLHRDAERALAWAVTRLVTLDHRASGLALALDAHLEPRVKIVVSGEGARAAALARSAWRLYEPGRIIERRPAGGDGGLAAVCIGDRCREGIEDPESIASTILDLRSSTRTEERSVATP